MLPVFQFIFIFNWKTPVFQFYEKEWVPSAVMLFFKEITDQPVA